ncbi:hypothetical protein FA15DRAFT_598021 [Coprinopsis marcescibilis]|uniref:Uncharacterized protein n=1 Tax=Coprinopsis marcescibilis TaxID=230819 RepID=A0A5C3KMR3_COPMA|nr:hypothetical protein FA15DRAFT_598021 [Coprinopsis marcescibilis]
MTRVTSVFNGNYSIPVHFLLSDLAERIDDEFFPGLSPPPPVDYLAPLRSAYDTQKGAALRKAIFPSFFHGKCQDPATGINPAGCPNPDCPVVCGTPGSMVHFYSRLRFIAFNETWHLLHRIAKPDSGVFREVQQNIEDAQTRYSRAQRRDSNLVFGRRGLDWGVSNSRRANGGVKSTLEGIINGIRFSLERLCGGSGDGRTNGLPYCSWENEMKEYILTFP